MFVIRKILATALCVAVSITMIPVASLTGTVEAYASGYVAQVINSGGQYVGDNNGCYGTLAEAVTAAEALSDKTATINMIGNTTENVSISDGTTITLDLKGKDITAASAEKAVISNTGSLTIKDSTATGTYDLDDSGNVTYSAGKITGGKYGIETSGNLTIQGGIITQNSSGTSAAVRGAGVSVCKSSVVMNMTGGLITGNTTTGMGGGIGIYNSKNVTISISGGAITKNRASSSGGGVGINDGGTGELNKLNISDNACIAYNHSDSSGGGIYSYGKHSEVNVNGGRIYKNDTAKYGGGIRGESGACINISDGTIEENESTTYPGGGVYCDGKLSMTGGTIKNSKYYNTYTGSELYMNFNSSAAVHECSISGGTIENENISETEYIAYVKGGKDASNNEKVNIFGTADIRGQIKIGNADFMHADSAISGGKFTGAPAFAASDEGAAIPQIITGGIYTDKAAGYNESAGTFDLSEHLAAGKSIVANTDQATKGTYPWMVESERIVVREEVESKIDGSITDSEEQAAAAAAIGEADVSGVAEALEEKKSEFAVDVAKNEEKKGTLTEDKVNDAALVEISITVELAVTGSDTKSSVQDDDKLLVFEVTPYAVVKATDGDGNTVSSEKVEVTNEYLAKTTDKPITVKVGSTFKPEQAVHIRKDGTKEVFKGGDEASFADKLFKCEGPVDKTAAYHVTVEILQFSELKLLGSDKYKEITVNKNGGTGEQEAIYAMEGETFALPECTLIAPAGCHFVGWQYKGVTYMPGDYVIAEEGEAITAIWEEHATPVVRVYYNVVFDVQGHGVSPASQRKIRGAKVKKPEDPAEEGYVFEGWFKEPACVNAWDFEKDTVKGNITLYAKWAEKTKIDISECGIILTPTVLSFNKKIQVPDVNVSYPSGKELSEGTDYNLTVKDSVKVGSYTVSVKGTGSFTGEAKAIYRINPAKKGIRSAKGGKKRITVKWSKSSKPYLSQTSGYQIKYSTSKNFRNYKTKKVNRRSTSKTVTHLKTHKKYYLKLRVYKVVDGRKYYSAWSKVKTVTTR